MLLGLNSLPMTALIALFVASAALVWAAASRLTRLVDAIADRTGIGQAFSGMLLLGGITSLPEVGAVSTSAAIGNAPLAVNNLLGTASINIMLLALADVVYGRGALTTTAARPAVLMQGVLSMLLASAVALVAAAGDVDLFGAGVGATFIAAAAIGAIWLASNYQNRNVWDVVDEGDGDEDEEKQKGEGSGDQRSLTRLIMATALCAALILGAGFVLASAADIIAKRTGLGAGMVGFLLVGAATSLPEVSTIIAAVRLHRYQMAIGDVFGTNIFNVMLIFLADLIYRGEPVLSSPGRFEIVGAVLAVLLTGIYIVGLLERRNQVVLRMGYDTIAALVTFGVGVALLARVGGG
jgi:cation:H+ antiporter